MPERIPTLVVILCCVTALGITWYAGTRDKDFVATPTPEELILTAKEWEQNRPNIPPPQPINKEIPNTPSAQTQATPDSPAKQEIISLPTGNLLHSPALSEYGTEGDKGAEAMVQLATLLETKGELQRALLAWERVIDTSNPNDKERTSAATAIKRLKPSLSPWNPDPKADRTIRLHAGATLKNDDVLISAMKQAAEAINEASGFILRVETKASIGKAREVRTPRIPVAIWFSSQSGETANLAETPPISFMADPEQEKMLVAQIEAGIYALVRTHLSTNTSYSPLPEYPEGAKPQDLLHLHITRLMWREFASSMKE